MMWWWWLLACQPGGHDPDTPGEAGVPTPQITLEDGRVLDPTLDGEPTLSIAVAIPTLAEGVGCTVELELVSEHGAWLAEEHEVDGSVTTSFTGLTGDGTPFPPGAVELRAWTSCDDGGRGSATEALAVVRLAPLLVDVGAAEASDEVPLTFHKSDLVTVAEAPIDGPEFRLAPAAALVEAEDAGGTRREAPAPWSSAELPPWTDDADAIAYNVPAGLVAGAVPVLTITPATTAWAGSTVVEAVPEGVEVLLDGAPWTDGVTWELDPLASTAGRETLTVSWAFSACLDGDCAAVPGELETAHVVYRLMGPSALFDGSDAGYADERPWLATLATTAESVEGAADALEVLDALRDRVHEDPWLLYDPSDSSYSEYDGEYIYWESITSELSSWLDRADGLSLYCHSVSCLLSTLAQSWGVESEQIVLGVGFRTHQVRAAGSDDWGRWSFNSHSVAGLETDDGLRVWDASIALDGDEDPASSPSTELTPSGLLLTDYLELLTSGDIDIVNRGSCLVR